MNLVKVDNCHICYRSGKSQEEVILCPGCSDPQPWLLMTALCKRGNELNLINLGHDPGMQSTGLETNPSVLCFPAGHDNICQVSVLESSPGKQTWGGRR